jgi:hypothetical protein
MKCLDAELDMVENGAEMSAETRGHLEHCAPCAQFARAQELALLSDELVRPSAALDLRVQAAVHECMATQRVWRRFRRLGSRALLPLAAAALILLGFWLRLSPTEPAADDSLLAVSLPNALDEPALSPSSEDLWLLSMAMTEIEIAELEESLAQLIGGVKESSSSLRAAPRRNDAGAMEQRLEDFREKLMALEFELLGDM